MKVQKSFLNKQRYLVERGDTGNFLNLPYHNEMKGLRYAINDNGAGCTLEEFYQLYDVYSRTKEEVEKIKTEEEKNRRSISLEDPLV